MSEIGNLPITDTIKLVRKALSHHRRYNHKRAVYKGIDVELNRLKLWRDFPDSDVKIEHFGDVKQKIFQTIVTGKICAKLRKYLKSKSAKFE